MTTRTRALRRVLLATLTLGSLALPASAAPWREPRAPLAIAPHRVVFSTYLGGSAADQAWAMAADAQGNSYIAGYTASSDFPTFNALQPASGGAGDAFVAKFGPRGELVYSTYLGGSNLDVALGIAVDGQGAVYVTGWTGSSNFPVVNAYQPSYHGGWDAFVVKLAPDGQSLVYSTFLGGASEENATAIAVDASGNAFVTGETQSTDFPLAGALQNQLGGSEDAFVAELAPGGDALVFSTYLGGALGGEKGLGIAVDAVGEAHVTGWTTAGDFPTANAFQANLHGGWDAFVTKLSPAGDALVYSTYLGGNDLEYVDEGLAITLDSEDIAHVAGFTGSTDFPVQNALQPFYGGQIDAFVTRFSKAGAVESSTYLGGSNSDVGYGVAMDGAAAFYLAGLTISDDYPVIDPIQPTLNGFEDALVSKLSAGATALDFSTYYGGGPSGREEWGATGVAIGAPGSIHLVGQTSTLDFPVLHAYQSFNRGSYDAFVVRISEAFFADGFESGDTSAWSATVGGP
jgi:hypothetical protein